MTPDVSNVVKEGYDLLEGIGIIERTESGQYYPTEVGAAIIYVVLCKQMFGAGADDFKSVESQQVMLNRLEEMDLVKQGDESFIITIEGFTMFFTNLAYDCPCREEFLDWLALATAKLATAELAKEMEQP
jgi:hypothetical protein